MSMKPPSKEKQPGLWIATTELARTPGHPFYDRLNRLLAEAKFDEFVEERCRRFHAEGKGRPSIPPGVYMRMLLIGFFEGLDSERGIAWRCADSLPLRRFLGFQMSEETPNHSSLCRIRQRLDLRPDWSDRELARDDKEHAPAPPVGAETGRPYGERLGSLSWSLGISITPSLARARTPMRMTRMIPTKRRAFVNKP